VWGENAGIWISACAGMTKYRKSAFSMGFLQFHLAGGFSFAPAPTMPYK
jgi:hypothetical protein